MDNINAKKLETVLTDKGFTRKLLTLDAPEDVQKAFIEKEIFFTLDEVKEIGVALSQEISSMNEDELPEEDLEAVAGGFFITGVTVIGIAKLIIAVAGLGLAVYQAHNARW